MGMNEEKNICPYCGSEKVIKSKSKFEKAYYCEECECFFDNDEFEIEDIRHKISAILMETDEEHPLKCYVVIEDEEACGLSTLLMPTIDECYQEPCEGRIWFHYEGHYVGIISNEKGWTNFDDIDLPSLRAILDGLQDELDVQVINFN